MPGLPGVNLNLPARATQTVASGLVRGGSAVASSLVTSGFFIAVVTAAYVLMRKFITAYRRNHLLSQVGQASADGLAIGYAQRAYTAMISGYGWWNDLFGDGTDEEALYQMAREMHTNKVGFSLVSSKYKVLYNRELVDDLTSELSAEELTKFNSLLQSGLGGLGNVPPSKHHLLYTVADTTVYDDRLQVVGSIPARMRLGEHVETLLAPTGQVWHGFPYRNLIRFVPADAVNRIEF